MGTRCRFHALLSCLVSSACAVEPGSIEAPGWSATLLALGDADAGGVVLGAIVGPGESVYPGVRAAIWEGERELGTVALGMELIDGRCFVYPGPAVSLRGGQTYRLGPCERPEPFVHHGVRLEVERIDGDGRVHTPSDEFETMVEALDHGIAVTPPFDPPSSWVELPISADAEFRFFESPSGLVVTIWPDPGGAYCYSGREASGYELVRRAHRSTSGARRVP